MKCQECGQPATNHVTEIVAGEFVEYHVCDTHLGNLEALKPAPLPDRRRTGFEAFLEDSRLQAAIMDPAVRQELAAHLLPPLCLALLHQKPEVRIAASFGLMQFGADGRSAEGALRDALQDADERVAKAASLALEYIKSGQTAPGWAL
jgi:hypothetical protein